MQADMPKIKIDPQNNNVLHKLMLRQERNEKCKKIRYRNVIKSLDIHI